MPISTLPSGCSSRGASLGRRGSGSIADQLEAERSSLHITESVLRSFAEGFEPGVWESHPSGEPRFIPNFPTPESRAEHVAHLEAKAAEKRARVALLEGSPGDAQAFYLQRVELDSGGYDSGGAYWGHGAPLYRYESADGCLSGFFRVDREEVTETAHRLGCYGDPVAGAGVDLDRETAKHLVREEHPRARFFR